jgi:hypothetical protein
VAPLIDLFSAVDVFDPDSDLAYAAAGFDRALFDWLTFVSIDLSST